MTTEEILNSLTKEDILLVLVEEMDRMDEMRKSTLPGVDLDENLRAIHEVQFIALFNLFKRIVHKAAQPKATPEEKLAVAS